MLEYNIPFLHKSQVVFHIISKKVFDKIKKSEKNQKNFKKSVDKLIFMVYSIRVAARVVATWEHSSAGRASALQAEGHRFEPYCAHHFYCGLVVQLVRMPACHAGGRRFEPVPGRQFK